MPMSTKMLRQKKYQGNHRHRPEKRATRRSPEQVISTLIRHFNIWSMNLRTSATYVFDLDQDNHHQCTMTLPVFPNLQSIGNGAKSKKEAKANAIIAFLAHLERRKQFGLFVPYVDPMLLRHTRTELRRADVTQPDLNLNRNEYLLFDRIITKNQLKKVETLFKSVERICNVRIILYLQNSSMVFIYIVGAKSQQDLVRCYGKILFEPDSQKVLKYSGNLLNIINDQQYLDSVCSRLRVLCDNQKKTFRLLIRGSSVNVQFCYNELIHLHREFNQSPVERESNQKKSSDEFSEAARLDRDERFAPADEKESENLLDYSVYDDQVNRSILRVLCDEENLSEPDINPKEDKSEEPTVIEISDDSSDQDDVNFIERIQNTKTERKTTQIQPLFPPTVNENRTTSSKRILRCIVIDGQNIGRNSNDFNRSFSWTRLDNAINYFKTRGHENIIAFLPQYYRHFLNKNLSNVDADVERNIRDNLIQSRLIAFTPSRYKDGKRLTNYDDRFILQYAADNDAVVVSNDNFRDLERETNFRFVIHNRILPFATINDTFMPATDPLGRNGPGLEDFLTKSV